MDKTTPKETIKNSEVPKDAKVIALILESMGVQEYEPRVIHQFLEFLYSCVTFKVQTLLKKHPNNFMLHRICSRCTTRC